MRAQPHLNKKKNLTLIFYTTFILDFFTTFKLESPEHFKNDTSKSPDTPPIKRKSLEQTVTILLVLATIPIIYHYRHLLILLLKTRPAPSPEQKANPTRLSDKTCPECGDRMEQGYLIAPRGIYWSQDSPPLMTQGARMGLLDPSFRSEPLTLPGYPSQGVSPNLKAHRCKKCGVAIIELNSHDSGII